MPKTFLHGLLMTFIIILFFGCSSSGVAVRGYLQDKERVDQDLKGNAGYLAGTPAPQGPTKPTRKVYIIEVTKENKEKMMDGSSTSTGPAPVNQPIPQPSAMDSRDTYSPPQISLPNMDDTQPASSPQSSKSDTVSDGQYTQYTVEKDDTLQKISMKFYNSFGKWTKIYEANKSVIKNPDRIKPGTVLKIPKL